MSYSVRLSVVVVAVAVLLGARDSLAQVKTSGTIEGTVTDESRGMLPGVSITLRQVATGIHFEAVTDKDGVFRFLSVPMAADPYELRAELAGFSTVVITKIVVETATTQSLSVELKVGSLSETVTVVAETPLIDTKNSITRDTMDSNLLDAIPLVTRHFTEVGSLFAGIQYNPVDSTPANTQFHVRGQPTIGHGYAQDGANINSPYLGRNGMYLSTNAIERMEFLNGGFQAEYGEQAGGYVNIITKSGANKVRGAYTAYYKPEALGSKLQSGIAGQIKDKTPSNYNGQEGAIGGPIVKDRFWYFGAFQYRADDTGNILMLPIRKSRWWDTHAKLTYFQNSENQWNLVFDGDPMRQSNTTMTATVTPENQAWQKVDNYLWHLRQTHIVNSSMVLETQIYDLYLKQWAPPVNPTGNPEVTLVTPSATLVTGQRGTWSGWLENKLRVSAKLTKNTAQHTFKVGFDYSIISGWRNSKQLVPIFNDRRGVGGTLTRTDSKYVDRPSIANRQVAVYAQDTWTPTQRLAFEVGGRVDHERVTGQAKFAPRLGFSFAVPGGQTSKLYANWGLFYQYIPGTSYTFGSFLVDQRLYLVRNPVGLVGEDVLQTVTRNVLLPLNQPYTNAWTVGYERALPYAIRAGVSVSQSKINNQNISTRYSDRVEQGSTGRYTYKDVEVNLRKNFVENVEVTVAYTYSKNRGDTPSTLTLLQVPYRNGIMDWDTPHAVNVNGRARLPLGVELAGVYRYSTGRPHSIDNAQVGTAVQYVDKQGNPAGRNIYNIPNYTSMDMTLGRSQQIGPFDTTMQLQVFNVPNRVTILAVQTSLFGAGVPTRVDYGRQFQFSLDIKF